MTGAAVATPAVPAIGTASGLLAAAGAGDAGIFFIGGVPFWVVYAVAFGIVFCRAQGTYWLGRGVARGTVRTRWARRLESDRARRAIETVHRWGPIAVTLSFFTVGVQTVINLAAGYTRMPFLRYVTALLPGCAIWAGIWSTVGTAAFNAGVAMAATSPIGLALIAAASAGVAARILLTIRKRRRAGGPKQSGEPAGEGPLGGIAGLVLGDDERQERDGPGVN